MCFPGILLPAIPLGVIQPATYIKLTDLLINIHISQLVSHKTPYFHYVQFYYVQICSVAGIYNVPGKKKKLVIEARNPVLLSFRDKILTVLTL